MGDGEYEPDDGINIITDENYHKIERYCRMIHTQLSPEQRTSATQPVYLIKDDTGGVFPESKFDPQGAQLLSSGGHTIQQKSNGRFVDAHENERKDFALVTRTAQNNDTQRWIFTSLGNDTYTLQQKSNGRFIDAYENERKDFALVTRTAQNNDTQRWKLTPLGNDTYTIRQESNGRFVDAHEDERKDFALVTRTVQNNDTQQWLIKPL
jgi:protease II